MYFYVILLLKLKIKNLHRFVKGQVVNLYKL